MKNKPLSKRIKFALDGINIAFQTEKSFRSQIFFSILSIVFLIIIRPKAMWWALFLLANSSVLGAELLNTSIENTLDLLHPEKHGLIARAKDCAAAAVLVTSIGAVGVLMALTYDTLLGH